MGKGVPEAGAAARIYFGNPEAALYFDRFSYEPPLAPYGFPCMGGYFPFGPP